VNYVEAVVPPSGAPDRVPAPHWHDGIAVHYFHDGEAWGRAQEGRWTWLERSGGRWFLWADPKDPVLVWHEDHWWWQSRGTWFVLHDGEAWIYRYLDDWQQEGLAHPDGSRMLYSRDGKAVGVLEPQNGARFYDAAGGGQVSRLSDAQTPKTHRPRVPSAVSLPR
jgi:hypothetical protein